MLKLNRRKNQRIFIGDDISVEVSAVRKGTVTLGISAPNVLRIDRDEVRQRRKQEYFTEINIGNALELLEQCRNYLADAKLDEAGMDLLVSINVLLDSANVKPTEFMVKELAV